MAKDDNTTRPTEASVADYLASITDEKRRRQCAQIDQIMQAVTRRPPTLWGTQIVGYGRYHYRYDSGREGEHLITGFSSRARNITVYIMEGFDRHQELMAKLGPHSLGKSCLYIKDLDDIDLAVLRRLIRASVAYMRRTYKTE
jgi:hypothetical protein